MPRCPRCGFMIPDGETECPYCRKDVSQQVNRPRPAGQARHQLHAEEETPSPGPTYIRYAGFWRRFGAAFLDWCCAAALAFAAMRVCEILQYPFPAPFVMLFAAGLFFLVIVPILISSRYRASPGKIVFDSVVIGISGRPLPLHRSLLRELGKYVSLLTAGIGFFLIGFTERKQGLHDILARTVVVRRSEAHLQASAAHDGPLQEDRRALTGSVVIIGAILISLMVVFSFGFFLHKTVTPQGLAAHSLVATADTVAETRYPNYALPLYDTAIALQPQDTGILVKKVYILGKEGRVDEAQATLTRAMIDNPNDTVPVIVTGDLLYGSGQYQSAIRYYEKALGMDHEAAEVWVKKGDAYLALSIIEMQAIRDQYKTLTAKSRDPSSSSSDAATMDAFRSTESYRQAIAAYNEAIRIDPFTSVEISGRVLASTRVLLGTYQGILDDIGIDNRTSNQSVSLKELR